MEEDLYENEKDFGDILQTLNPLTVCRPTNRCVGMIYAQDVFVGTGFLLASNIVLTVAHNIYSRKKKCYFKGLVFYPGVSGDYHP